MFPIIQSSIEGEIQMIALAALADAVTWPELPTNLPEDLIKDLTHQQRNEVGLALALLRMAAFDDRDHRRTFRGFLVTAQRRWPDTWHRLNLRRVIAAWWTGGFPALVELISKRRGRFYRPFVNPILASIARELPVRRRPNGTLDALSTDAETVAWSLHLKELFVSPALARDRLPDEPQPEWRVYSVRASARFGGLHEFLVADEGPPSAELISSLCIHHTSKSGHGS